MKIDRNAEAERLSALEATYDDHEIESTERWAPAKTAGPMLNLSSGAQAVQKLRDAVDSTPSVRASRVEQLRQQYQAGTLDIDSSRLAHVMERVLRHV
jgi:flagellar biosynthesis anti-sigma factor FlgM